MTLTELYERQQNEIEQFKALRDKIWSGLIEEQRHIAEAFGGEEKLPDDMRKRFDDQKATYNHEWAMETGQRFQEMRHLHEQQRENMTGIPVSAPHLSGSSNNASPDPLTDKQTEMQKIIAQQQAIRKRQQENKRKR